jgi:hypothetical protein
MDSSRHLNFPVGYHPSVLRWAFLRRYGLSQGNPSTLARAIASASHHLGTLELSGIDHTINAARLRAIRESSSRYLTPKLPLVLDEQWSGLRPCTPDGLPVISVEPPCGTLSQPAATPRSALVSARSRANSLPSWPVVSRPISTFHL